MVNTSYAQSTRSSSPAAPTRRKKQQQGPPPPFELRCERLVVTDPAGNERIVLKVDPDGRAVFSMRDAEQNEMALIRVAADGEWSSCKVTTKSGDVVSEMLAQTDNAGSGYTSVWVSNGDVDPAGNVSMCCYADGSSNIQITDDGGSCRTFTGKVEVRLS